MSQIKRSLSFNQSVDIETKISRIKLDEKSLKHTCFEHLSNELLYEIFEYLDGYDMYKAFSNLNIRFQNSITCPSLLLQICLYTDSESILEERCRHFIIPNQHRIGSLSLIGRSLIDEFFKYCAINSSFNRLEILVLSSMTYDKLLIILSYLNSLPRLFSLTIIMKNDNFNLGNIYQSILSLSTLKYNSISLFGHEPNDTIMPITINENFSSIEYLIVDHSCPFKSLLSLLYHTPRLHQFTCKRLIQMDENVREILSITTPYLTYISIDRCYIKFNVFEMLIKKISSRLKELHIGIFAMTDYLDANRWEQLIKEHMPRLRKFYLIYEHEPINGNISNIGDTVINQFNSPFWIERKWFSELKINDKTIIFSIHPYRKEWFNFDESIEIDTHSNRNIKQNFAGYDNIYSRPEDDTHFLQFSPDIQLTFEGHTLAEPNRLLIKKIMSSLNAIQFTHLNIYCNNISISMLIKIIGLLPNINSLKISSLPILKLNNLSVKDTKNHFLVSTKNKITKVKLDKITEMNQIYFLINLCPRMQYFELGCMTNMNLEILIRFVLIQWSTYIPNLFCLCFNIPNTNEKMIENLSKTIDCETLLDDYTIQRIGDKIFLQWELQ